MTGPTPWQRARTPLLVLAAVRVALGIVAIPLAPLLYRDHYIVLVLLGPTKDVLLFGGFLLRRVSVFPSSILAAAAGASRLTPRQFLPLDGVGALLSLAEVIGFGYALGSAYRRGARLVTVIGVIALLAGLILLGRWIRRNAK